MAKVMGSKNPLTTCAQNDDEELYGVTPAGEALNSGKGTILPVHMAVRARYSLDAFNYV